MVFSSVEFLAYFLPLFLFSYAILPKHRNLTLAVFSLGFYAYGEPIYVVLLLISSTVDFFVSKKLEQAENNRKKYLLISILVNCALLGFFKYSDFLIEIFNFGFGTQIDKLNLPLPIGISFYTFQTMSYTIDVYRKKVKANKNYLDFLMYVSMFPQLIAGPIVRYIDIEKNIKDRAFNISNLDAGIKRFIIGFAKKIILADNMNRMYLSLSQNSNSQVGMIIAYIAFGLHIYFDFSGYSDMAIGLGKMIGFDFLENFNYPYISKSISEFFRRWHISLGIWFKEYVYFPLGGSRKTILFTVRNLLIVWLITGLWHGASLNFVLWGLFLGLFIILEKIIKSNKLPIKSNTFTKGLSHVYVLIVITLSWVLFANVEFSGVLSSIKAMCGIGVEFFNNSTLYFLRNYLVLFIIAILAATPIFKRISTKLPNWIRSILVILLLIVCVAEMMYSDYSPFIYFRF